MGEGKQERVIDKYGFLPTSVWKLSKGSEYYKELVKDEKREDIGYRRKSGGVFDGKGIRFSQFNPKVAERVYLYWSGEGDLVIDPFAGRSTRGIVAIDMGRRYLGYEIVPKTFELTKRGLATKPKTLLSADANWQMINGDGCSIQLTGDGVADLVFTCPPYWKLERYESCEGQLSDCKTYAGFLDRMKVCWQNIYRVLKAGKFAVMVVNDFCLQHRFYKLHIDMIELAERAGIRCHDIVINVLRSPFLFAKIGECDKARYTFKTHEYILVFRKDSKKR